MKPFSDDALEMAVDRIGSPNSPREAAGVFMCAEAIMFDFVVPAEQAFDWLDSLEYIRKSRALAEAQAGVKP